MRVGGRKFGLYSPRESERPETTWRRKWTEAWTVLEAAWTHSSEFRNRLTEAGMTPEGIQSEEDWSRIPVLHKKSLIEFQNVSGVQAMLDCQLGELSRIYLSPGPIFDPEARSSDYWGWAEAFYAAGFRAQDVVQMTFGYHLTPGGLMLEEPLRQIGCAIIPAGPGNTSVQVDLLTALPVTGFVGMASFLKVIKDAAVEQGRDLARDLSLRVAFVAAERLHASLRKELEEELGITVRQGYGTADVGCIAYECQHLGGMHVSSRCLVEICDPLTGAPLPPGEVGEVVVTPFSTTYPLVRLGTGDLSCLDVRPCGCGRTASMLTGILGRSDSTAKVKGQFIYPHQVSEVMTSFPAVTR